jgi:hypothetical protein
MGARFLTGSELERELDKREEQEPAFMHARRGPRNETEYNDAAREQLAGIGHRDPEPETTSQDDAVDKRWRPSDPAVDEYARQRQVEREREESQRLSDMALQQLRDAGLL